MQKRKIFIVDDSRVQLIMLKKILLAAGFSVQAFSNGHDLVKTLEKSRPDLIISDIDMPGLDGFELVAEIREKFGETVFPFLLISSEGGTVVQNRAREAGADLFLKKPFESNNLIDTVRQMLQPVKL